MRQRGISRALMVLLAVAALSLGGGAAGAAPQNMDLVVLVDTSESMFPYFDDLMNYLVQDLLTQRLHRGDTFHLLSFSSQPEVEISLAVNSEEAARQAFSRVLLLHALGRYTDLVSALQFLYKYVKELPETNPKHIIIATDGVQDPPPGSPDPRDPATVKSLLVSTAQAMRGEGWEVSILKVPPVPAPQDQGMRSYLGDIAAALGVPVIPYPVKNKQSVTGITTGYPTLIFPGPLGQVGNRFVASFRVKNWKSEPIILALSSVASEGTELLERRVSLTVPAQGEVALDVPIRLPAGYPTGAHEAGIKLTFDDDPRISPTEGTLSFTYTGKGGLPFPRFTLLYVLYIVLGLALIYVLVRLFLYLRRKLGEAPLTGLARTSLGGETSPSAPQVPAEASDRRAGRVPLMAERATRPLRGRQVALMDARRVPRKVHPTASSLARALPRQAEGQPGLPPLIEMRVDQQNHRVGFRNVHRIPPGTGRSIGGRTSTFLIFLVPMPSATAEIRNQDGRYVFSPLRPELFPALSGPIEDCLGKEIPFVSPNGHELILTFREWVSPLEEINRILRQARSPMT